jgi:phytoene synthase
MTVLLAKRAVARLAGRSVTDEAPDFLAPEAELALAWSLPKVRPALSIALQLDRRLARIVSRTSEPVLGQMRLTWWREALSKPPTERPLGDPVLEAIGEHWAGREAALIQMVDGWEVLVTAELLGYEEAKVFAAERGAFFAALAGREDGAAGERLAAAGFRWALADAATAVSDAEERAILIATGLACANARGAFPRGLRGLAVLEALALRALRRGGRPLMEGRGAPLAALRAAIFLS